MESQASRRPPEEILRVSPRRSRPVKKKRKNRQRMLLLVMLLLVIAGALTILSFTVFFKIRSIEISGQSRYSSEQITSCCGVAVGNNLLSVSEKKISASLTSQLPYIASVSVSRHLPGRLVIEVTPAEVSYAVSNEQGYWLISLDKKLLEQAADPNGACEILGADLIDPAVGRTLQYADPEKESAVDLLLQSCAAHDMPQISKLDVSKLSGIRILYDNRFILRVGTTEHLDYKLQFAAYIMNKEGAAASGTIELSALTGNSDGKDAYFTDQAVNPDDFSNDSESNK